MPFNEAVRKLAKRANLPVPEDAGQQDGADRLRRRVLELNRDAARWYYDLLCSPEGAAVQAYLDKYYSGYDDIKVSITDQEKLDQDDFSDYFDFDLEEDADLEIKKAVQFDLKVRYQSDEGKQTEKEVIFVFRNVYGWYSVGAVFGVAMSAYL